MVRGGTYSLECGDSYPVNGRDRTSAAVASEKHISAYIVPTSQAPTVVVIQANTDPSCNRTTEPNMAFGNNFGLEVTMAPMENHVTQIRMVPEGALPLRY